MQDQMEDEQELEVIDPEKDTVAETSQVFKTWSVNLNAQVNSMRVMLKIADLVDSAGDDEDDDDEFEDIDEEELKDDDEGMDEDESSPTIIDMD